MKMDDNIILLMKDGKISLCTSKDVSSLTKKDSDVKYVMIDVGMYTNEYVMIPKERFIRKFKHAVLNFEYHIEAYCEGLTCSTDPRPGKIVCNNVVDFYRAVHSIQKLWAVALLMHDDFYAISCEGKLSQVDISITIGKHTQNICIETTADSTSMYDAEYVLESINYMVYGNPSINVIPDKVDNPNYISVDVNNLMWTYGFYQTGITASFQECFKCWSFIPSDIYDLIFMLDSGVSVTQYVYVPITQNYMPDIEIDGSTIYDLDGTYLEVLFERDLSFRRVDIGFLIEFIMNAKYIFFNGYAECEAQYGEMNEDLLLVVSYSFLKEYGPRYNFKPLFEFSINREMIDSNADIYQKFVKSLERNYKKFSEGRCEEDD